MKVKTVLIVPAAAAIIALAAYSFVRPVTAAEETSDPWTDYQTVSLTVTNGMSLSLMADMMILTPTGQANNGTNTLKFVTPFTTRKPCVVQIADTATNRILFAQNTKFIASADVVMIANSATRVKVFMPTSTTNVVALY